MRASACPSFITAELVGASSVQETSAPVSFEVAEAICETVTRQTDFLADIYLFWHHTVPCGKRETVMQLTLKEFGFEAAHQTPPYGGLHGHSFRVEVALTGKPHAIFGWTHNLLELEPIIAEVRHELDHRYLNEIEGLSVPTLENVARWIWARLETRVSGLRHVAVRRGLPGESEGCFYSPFDEAAFASPPR